MLSQLNNLIVALMDFLLGWLLRFPSDVQLFVVAIGSALILALVRRWTTDQGLLKRCRQDKAQLKQLLRAAKARKDTSAVQRHRATLGMIAMKQLRQEGRPLLASLLPIVLLATWALNRLEFHPLKAGDPFEFTASFPISATGKIVHLTPCDGVAAQTGWIQEIAAVTDQGPAHGMASWLLTSEARAEPRRLQVRYGTRTFEHPFLVGTRTYEPPQIVHDEQLFETKLKMRPVQLFGIVPDLPALHFPAWLVAYLIIIIPFTFLTKKVLRIY